MGSRSVLGWAGHRFSLSHQHRGVNDTYPTVSAIRVRRAVAVGAVGKGRSPATLRKVTRVRAIVIGSIAVVVLLAITAGGLRSWSNRSSNGPPIWDTAVWDGEQFVINESFYSDGDEGSHWTSPDGIEWTRQPGFIVEAGRTFCEPKFPCDLVPDEMPSVPLMFSTPQSFLVTGRGDLALAQVNARYDLVEDLPESDGELPGFPVRLHRSVLAMAAQESECFEKMYAAGPSYRPTPGEPELTSFGGGAEGNNWVFSATCRHDGNEHQFSVDLTEHLTPAQIRLFERGSNPELWVVATDGSQKRVENPPTTTYRDGDPSGDEPLTTVAEIATSRSRFWAVGGDGLVVSTDGVDWTPFEVDTHGRLVERVVANPGGDVALVLTDTIGFDHEGETLVMVSHDDGETWGDIIPLASDSETVWVTSVGPPGIAVNRSEARSEISQFINDTTGEVVFSAVSTIGSDHLTVGRETVLMPRERVAADGEYLGPVLDVYDTSGALITTVFPD